MSKQLILLVGPPGSGKSTIAQDIIESRSEITNTDYFVRISQDDQGKDGHKKLFLDVLQNNKDIIVDRLNFSKEQRERYLKPAKEAGYKTKIIVLQTARHICFTRMGSREDHPTIKDMKTASSAFNTFMKQYERPTEDEADEIEFIKTGTNSSDLRDKISKPTCIVVDLDGTLCNVDHRLHHLERHPYLVANGENEPIEKYSKPNWKAFFEGIPEDKPNVWCEELVNSMCSQGYKIVYASGRPDSHRKSTEEWLNRHDLLLGPVFMRERNDFRSDVLAKEAILDFCIEPSYNIMFILDDRASVCEMWRSRGYTVLQCAPGDF